jgi:hypothetical protein
LDALEKEKGTFSRKSCLVHSIKNIIEGDWVSWLLSPVLRRWRLGESRLETKPGKKLARPVSVNKGDVVVPPAIPDKEEA